MYLWIFVTDIESRLVLADSKANIFKYANFVMLFLYLL